MRKIEQIEVEIGELSTVEFAELREWILARDADTWDAQFEADVREGKLNPLGNAARLAHESGKTTKI